MTDNILREAKRLYNLGFAIHWLHPKSKRPIGDGWGAGERKSWEELKATYVAGNNVGVRLGEPSKIGAGYLCVIDVDVKSELPHHRKEAMTALRALVLEAAGELSVALPQVRSGRGNGSRHLYCITPQPFKTFDPASSEEVINYLSPSKSPNKKEREVFSEEQLAEGWRQSKAWEISLYSSGRQVVLPPSIHPDTNKPYFWKAGAELSGVDSLVVLNFKVAQESTETKKKRSTGTGSIQEEVNDVEIDETLDIRWLPGVDENTRKLIEHGLWRGVKVEDRSAYLVIAANGLFSAGLGKREVLTVLTDKSTYLGECAFDHAQTKNRKRAMKWLWNYTVKKIEAERDPVRVFKGVPVERARKLSSEEAAEQVEEIESEKPWTSELAHTKNGEVKPTLMNCVMIIEKSCGQPEIVARNEFANQDYYLCDSAWRSKAGDQVTDMDLVRLKEYCAKEHNVEFGDNTINQALIAIADRNRFHPVKEWLATLSWDGVPRIETWLKDYAGAEGPDEYLRAVSCKMLVAMVKRIMEPGCKFDHVVILEGLQGLGKSTLLSTLVGEDWFTDQPLVIGDKDSVLAMQSKWLIELGELASLNRGELEAMKAFITQRTDRIRSPYGRRMEDFPRQSIFVGSTNKDEYMRDETGNRRFWPVKCTVVQVDFDAVKAVREQLFAEAKAYYEMGEPLYLENALVKEQARLEQSAREESDEWTTEVAEIVNGELFVKNGFSMRDLSSKMRNHSEAWNLSKQVQSRLSRILNSIGFEKYQESGGQRRKLWATKVWLFERKKSVNLAEWDRQNHLNVVSEPPQNHLGGSTKTPMIADFY